MEASLPRAAILLPLRGALVAFHKQATLRGLGRFGGTCLLALRRFSLGAKEVGIFAVKNGFTSGRFFGIFLF